jgi:hypothetical protein
MNRTHLVMNGVHGVRSTPFDIFDTSTVGSPMKTPLSNCFVYNTAMEYRRWSLACPN